MKCDKTSGATFKIEIGMHAIQNVKVGMCNEISDA